MGELDSLTGKRILVIGASSGIGARTAITLSERSANVILAARGEDKLRETLAQLTPGDHAYYPMDAGEPDSVAATVKKCVAEHGKLDGMVYCAGTSGDVPINLLSREKLEAVFRVNYFGFIDCVRAACKKGVYNDGMRIVAVSSLASIIGQKAHTAYAGSKGAMDASVRCLAIELAPKGICINSVAPAMIRTRMFEDYAAQNGEDSDAVKLLLARQLLGLGETTDIANAVCFLLSPEARFITGITLPVDGGTLSN